MHKNRKKTFILFVLSALSLNLSAQYGPQLDNSGFEQWTNRDELTVSEPTHWHSGGTATGSFSGLLSSQIEQSTHVRPGSSGSKSVRIYPTSVLGITANGNLTNGRMNAGSMSATGSGNYNYTQRAESAFNTPITQLPDSLSVWVCFRSSSTSSRAQVKAVVHGNADYKLIANGTEEPAEMHVATAVLSFTRTSTANGSYNWQRLSIPFNNSGPCTDVRYILMTATTNETPGSGSTNDDLFVDDVLLIYNPTLTMGQLESDHFQVNEWTTIPFTLSGTMSPNNLNADPNVVIAQLSDANGNFDNPTELGRKTTQESSSIMARIPDVTSGEHYRIRVISTNYPMVGGNIQEVSITVPTYTVSVAANPTNGGTVSGGGTYNFGQSCTVTASANTGFTFSHWTENGNYVTSQANYTFTVEGDRNLVANFTANTYTVSVAANPSNAGTVSGGGTFTYGQSCTVTASANTGYTFTNWTENGSVVSSNANYTFTVEGDRNLVANFTANTYTVSVAANPNNGGTVSGGGSYNYGQACTVIATSTDGYTFLNWTENGSVVSNDANYSFTVTGNRSLVANFNEQLPDTYNINVSPNPIIGGIVTGGGTYDADQQCTVTATPNPNYNFINWTEDGEEVSTEASYTFIVAGNRNLVANFQYVVGIEENGSSCHIYPNPTASVVSITTERAAQSISIYDLYGRLLMKHSVDGEQLEIDLSDLSPGAYLLQIDYGDRTTVHRVIKAE